MYKATQRNGDFFRRVGSSATKPKSNPAPQSEIPEWDALPTVAEMTLQELRDERERLIAMGEWLNTGYADVKRRNRITMVNRQIKYLNVEVSERYNSACLYKAVRDICDEELAQKIFDAARAFRMADEEQ